MASGKTRFDAPKNTATARATLISSRQAKMILTNCAACAAPLAHTAPRCVRCDTRYCKLACKHDHWRRGHKQICKIIRGGGKAEQYHANKKYKEAVAVAVEACEDDQREAVAVLAEDAKARRRIFGTNHPTTTRALHTQERATMRLEDVDAPPS